MKKVFKRKASWVSYDGKEFDTKRKCQKYEKEHPEPEPSLLDKKIAALEDTERIISCHKKLNWEFYEDRGCCTWHCGQEHQKALKKLAEAKNDKDKKGIDKLIAIGVAAQIVRSWKLLEKKAYARLMDLRKQRNRLRAEIADLRTSIKSYEDK